MNKFSFFKSKTGLTLIETSIVIGIVSVFIGIVFAFFLTTNRAYKSRVSRGIAENLGTFSVYNISSDLRETKIPTGTSLPPIESATTNSIIFYADTKEGASDMEERVRYFLDGENLTRGTSLWSESEGRFLTENEEIKIINNHVVNGESSIFTYFGEDYTGTESPLSEPINSGQIRVVNIKILTDIDVDQEPEAFEIETLVDLRNLN